MRKAFAEDMVEIMRIEFECFSYPYPPSVINFLFEHFGGFFYVAEEDGLAGYIVGVPKKEEGHIVSLAVRHKFRRNKVGTMLLKRLSELFACEEKGKMALEVRASNKSAQSFYARNGFKIRKVIKEYYENGEDAYFMEKALDGEIDRGLADVG